MLRRAPLFLLLLVGLDFGLAALFARGFARERAGASGGFANQAIAARADLLVVGSSRARHHLDPEILGPAAGLRAWNAGVDGQGLYYACSLLDLVARRSIPRVVVWSLDLNDFDPRSRPGQLQRLSVLLPHYEESARLRALWRSQGYEARLKVQVRTYRFNSLVLPMLVSLFGPALPPPWGGFAPLAPLAPRSGVLPPEGEAPESEREAPEYDPDPEALRSLEEAARGLAGRGCEVLLLTQPRFSVAPPTGFYERFDRRFEDLASRIPRVTFWRMDEVVVPEFRDPDLFVDPGHLNAEGARRLSTLVAGRIRSEIRPRIEVAPSPSAAVPP